VEQEGDQGGAQGGRRRSGLGRRGKEARKEGDVEVAWDGEATGYRRAPASEELVLPDETAYVYYCSNETIQGVQFSSEPEVGERPLVCDASSDFLSRPVAVERYSLLHACAQKNAGPAGLTLVIVSDEFLERHVDEQHAMLDYRAQAEAGSRLNTPPTFAIYVFLLVTRWLRDEIGGLEAMAERNRDKAHRLYELIGVPGDDEAFYRGHAEPSARSLMNVTFRLPTSELEQQFLAEAAERDLRELKGHRSVGGIRASIYNAMPVEGVAALRDFMVAFRDRNAS
jgi:phosphoserine aminotransferase